MQFQKDRLTVDISSTRDQMGQRAAEDIAACMSDLLRRKPEINMIFAAAPSQNEVLAALVADQNIEWNRVHAFHMDEYIGLPADAPQRFGHFLRRALFDAVPFRSVNLIDSTADAECECARYTRLLQEHPVDIVVLGIGENGHIAFNDPPAPFDDAEKVKVVTLDAVCRMQQVHDGCFASLDAVPTQALTLTVPALSAAAHHFCVVPAETKAWAVARTVHGLIGPDCPATVLRTLPHATLYCDAASASQLPERAMGKGDAS